MNTISGEEQKTLLDRLESYCTWDTHPPREGGTQVYRKSQITEVKAFGCWGRKQKMTHMCRYSCVQLES